MAEHDFIKQAYSEAFYHYLRLWQNAGVSDWGFIPSPPKNEDDKGAIASLPKNKDDRVAIPSLSQNEDDRVAIASLPKNEDDTVAIPMNKMDKMDKMDKMNEMNKVASVPSWQDLATLEKAIRDFDGCDLKKFASNTVFARGSDKADVMCVGEAPGADEDREGKPFVGRSGRLLDMMFNAIGLGAGEVRIGNIVPWRPPGNRQPSMEEIRLCLPFIRRHIELVKPRVLIFLGNVAVSSLLDLERTSGISRLRGRWHEYHMSGCENAIPVRPMFHPAYLLRAPLNKKLAWQDLCAIREKLDEAR